MKKHFLADFFETKVLAENLSALASVSSDAKNITYSVTRFLKGPINQSSFIKKLKQSCDSDIVNNDFDLITFTKKFQSYEVNYEITFHSDDSSVNVEIFTTGPISDQKQDIENLANYFSSEISYLSSIAKQSF